MSDRAIAWPHPHLTARSEAEYQRLIALDPARLVFVFGSTLSGNYSGGRYTQIAVEHFGATPGRGYGWHGRSYAVPVMDVAFRTLPMPFIWGHVARMLQTAAQHPEFTFYVTPLGTGRAQLQHADVAPLFADRTDNVLLPPEWLALLASTPQDAPLGATA